LAYNCPYSSASKSIATRASSDRIGVSNLQVSFGFAQKDKDIIPASWILLDTCSTVSIGNDSALIGSIEDCSEMDSLKVTNGGSKSFNQKAKLKLLPMSIYYNEDSMANILAFADVAFIPGVKITMDTKKERAMNVLGLVINFIECSQGLYFFDTSNTSQSKSGIIDYSFSYHFK